MLFISHLFGHLIWRAKMLTAKISITVVRGLSKFQLKLPFEIITHDHDYVAIVSLLLQVILLLVYITHYLGGWYLFQSD